MSQTKIKNLTLEQEEKMPAYVEKYLNLGLSTTPFSLEEATPIIDDLYTKILGKKKVPIIIMDSPIHAWIATCLFASNAGQVRNQVWNQVGEQVRDQVREQVWEQVGFQVGEQVRNQVGFQVREQVREQVQEQVGDQVWEQVWKQVGFQVGEQVGNQVREQVRDQVWEQVREQVREQVGNQVGEQVRNQVGFQVREQVREQVGDQVWEQVRDQVGEQVGFQVGEQVRKQVWEQVGFQVGNQVGDQVRKQVVEKENFPKFVWPWLDGQFQANIFAFYHFMIDVVGIKLPSKLRNNYLLWKETIKLSLIYPLDNICILSQKPTEIHMENGVLHKDGSPSVRFKNCDACWSLWGVTVPKWLAETPADKIDVKEIMKLENSEHRAVAIRKVGFQRIASELKSNTISKTSSANLLEFEIDEVKTRRLHVFWETKDGKKEETFIAVPKDRDAKKWQNDIPDNIDDAEQVRRWTLGLSSKHEFVQET